MRFDKLKVIVGTALVTFMFLATVIIVSGLIIDKAQKQTSQSIDNVAAIINNKTKNNTVSSVVNIPAVNTPVASTPVVDNTSTTPVVNNTPVVTPPPAPIVNPPTRRTRAS
jgi:hypothetical protein